ncbi:MAG: glutamate synthase subunit beta [Ignavibacteriae bacterium]|nr:glutamate synthase subunit beta [Ignavibacteriota bacterium]
MGEVKGFTKYTRKNVSKESISTRLTHWNEFTKPLSLTEAKEQGARCMDCGTPFCQFGCPIDNIIPDWNDLVYKGKMEEAYTRLTITNNFPEFTSRVCPAPCENSCVLEINNPPVAIKNIEHIIIEEAFEQGWIRAKKTNKRSGKKIAIVGSGPAGLACADELNKLSNTVSVFEKNEIPGGLLTFGIPEFKLEKQIVNRRIKIMEEEGITFKTNCEIGKNILLSKVLDDYDAVVLCGGAETPRDLNINGRNLEGIHFAMDFLTQQNRNLLGFNTKAKPISASNKNVVVIGGGDTGSDCIGTANRQGAKSVTSLELMPQLPKNRNSNNPWPQWAFIDRTSTSHEEGCKKYFGVLTKKFTGKNGKLEKLHLIEVEFNQSDAKQKQPIMKEIKGSEFTIDTDLVFLAMGFLGAKKSNLLNELNVELDGRGNVKTDKKKMTNIDGLFAAGDMRRGQSLVVWAINEGREVAKNIDKYISV